MYLWNLEKSQWGQPTKKHDAFIDQANHTWAFIDANPTCVADQNLKKSLISNLGLEPINPKNHYNFGIVFSLDSNTSFQHGRTAHLDRIIFSPSLTRLRQNGVLKKTLWLYFHKLGIMQLSHI